MIPGWKIQRELRRLQQQLQAIPERFWEPRATRQYDRAFPAQLKITEGEIAARPDIGLFLIYPGRGGAGAARRLKRATDRSGSRGPAPPCLAIGRAAQPRP